MLRHRIESRLGYHALNLARDGLDEKTLTIELPLRRSEAFELLDLLRDGSKTSLRSPAR